MNDEPESTPNRRAGARYRRQMDQDLIDILKDEIRELRHTLYGHEADRKAGLVGRVAVLEDIADQTRARLGQIRAIAAAGVVLIPVIVHLLGGG